MIKLSHNPCPSAWSNYNLTPLVFNLETFPGYVYRVFRKKINQYRDRDIFRMGTLLGPQTMSTCEKCSLINGRCSLTEVQLKFLPELSPCKNQKLDVCLIVDSSTSVGVRNFVRVKTFLIQFIDQFEPDTHFSIITFARTPTVWCKLNDPECQSIDGTHVLVTDLPDKVYRGTHTDKALVAADQIVFTAENGDRADANNVVVAITDGRTRENSLPFNVTIPPLRVCFSLKKAKGKSNPIRSRRPRLVANYCCRRITTGRFGK